MRVQDNCFGKVSLSDARRIPCRCLAYKGEAATCGGSGMIDVASFHHRPNVWHDGKEHSGGDCRWQTR